MAFWTAYQSAYQSPLKAVFRLCRAVIIISEPCGSVFKAMHSYALNPNDKFEL